MDVSAKIKSKGKITTNMIKDKVGEDFCSAEDEFIVSMIKEKTREIFSRMDFGSQVKDLDKKDFGGPDYGVKPELKYNVKAAGFFESEDEQKCYRFFGEREAVKNSDLLGYNAKSSSFFKTKVLMFVENKF